MALLSRLRPRGPLFLLWLVCAFGGVFFARELQAIVWFGWPLGYWFAAQGAVLMFIAIVAAFAWHSNRGGEADPSGLAALAYASYKRRLHRRFARYVSYLLIFLVALAAAEQWGLPKPWVGAIFLVATLLLYAGIGLRNRTADADEYYVAGRRIPALYNGMATAADWMSAASFISLAGGLYLQGFSGAGNQPGGLAYVLGLGGVLVCSFLGGMRAVTWTQVTQYVVLILAFLIPVSWLAYKQLGNPLAPWVYGQQLERLTQLEGQLMDSPAEQQVIQEYARRAQELERKLVNVEAALATDRLAVQERLRLLAAEGADVDVIFSAKRELALLPKDTVAARELWTRTMQDNLNRAKPLGGVPRQVQPFAGDPQGSAQEQASYELSRRNFLALMFCLMLGTVGMPHLLTRFFTTPTVAEARTSVAWSLFFIALLYLAAPALAVLVKYEVMSHLVGQNIDALPGWMGQWARVDPTLLSFSDVNGDHKLQFSELRLGADLIMLATPELGGLPYVVSGLVAAGGLAAALSTADGLLLTIGNALSHDLVARREPGDRAAAMRQVMLSKFALLLVALLAAYVAAQKSGDILFLVTASFSLAAAAFVPAMVLGIFWAKTSRAGAVSGMLAGVLVTVYYMVINAASVRAALGLESPGLWLGIQPVSAGVFGVSLGVVVTVLVSLITLSGRRPPGLEIKHL